MSGCVASNHANNRSCRLRNEFMFQEAMHMGVAAVCDRRTNFPGDKVRRRRAPLQLDLQAGRGYNYLRVGKFLR